MKDFYVLIGLILISVCIAAVLIKVLCLIDNRSRTDGEIQIFSDNEKDIYRFVIYKNIENLSKHKVMHFKIIDLRDKNKDNNENFRKEDVL